MKWMFLLTLATSLNSHAIVIRHDVSDQKYLDAAANDNSTVTFYGIYEGKEIVEGTGALIASDWIVIAAHVAKFDWPTTKSIAGKKMDKIYFRTR